MKIKSIEIESLSIPFNFEFAHASMVRYSTETVLVKVYSEDDQIGFGEGCPREYVTGESVASAQDFFSQHQLRFLEIETFEDLWKLEQELKLEVDKNPAAYCALEMALLDLLGKICEKSVEELLGVANDKTRFQYTAVLGSSKGFEKVATQYKDYGFKDYKVKISGNLSEDKNRLKFLKEFYEGQGSLRVDANNMWHSSSEAIAYLKGLGMPLLGVEEPLGPGNYEGFQEVYKALHCPIILDESFKKVEDFLFLNSPKPWIINVRVSKMGGLLRSLRVVEEARRFGVKVVLGAQVGETSLLTRAALVVAKATGNQLMAQEGAVGTHLIKHDVVEKSLQFGKMGILNLKDYPDIEGPGLGLPMTIG